MIRHARTERGKRCWEGPRMRVRGKALVYQPLGQPESGGRKIFRIQCVIHSHRASSGRCTGERPCDGSRRTARFADPRTRRPSTNPLSRSLLPRTQSGCSGREFGGGLPMDSFSRALETRPGQPCTRTGDRTKSGGTCPSGSRTESVNRPSSRTPVAVRSVSQPCHRTRSHRTDREPNSPATRTTRRRLSFWRPSCRDSWTTTCIHGKQRLSPPDARRTRWWQPGPSVADCGAGQHERARRSGRCPLGIERESPSQETVPDSVPYTEQRQAEKESPALAERPAPSRPLGHGKGQLPRADCTRRAGGP